MLNKKIKKLTIIISVYNEVKTIKQVLFKIIKTKLPVQKEIIVVDDGSKDNSRKIIQLFIKNYNNPYKIKTIFKNKNDGKTKAIKDALKFATGDFVIIQDADLEYDINDYPKLLEPLLQNKADMVIGSRFKGNIKKIFFTNYIANKFLSFLANLIYGIDITDEASGYKLFKTKYLKRMKPESSGFNFCPEVIAKAAKMKLKIVEVPINYKARTIREGKKIRWYHAFSAIWTLIKYRFKKINP